MRRVFVLFICLLILLTSPRDWCSAKVNSVKANPSYRKAEELRIGNNKVTVNYSKEIAYVKYVASRTGKYKFKIDGIRSKSTRYPIITLKLHSAKFAKSSLTNYREISLPDFKDGFSYIRLMSPEWSRDVASYEVIKKLKGTHYTDKAKITVNLKKGTSILFVMYDINNLTDEFGNEEPTSGKVTYNIKIKRL